MVMTASPDTSPPWVYVAAAVVAVLIVLIVASTRARAGEKDPRRMYSADERAAMFARAGGQCEYAAFGIFRCTRTASHGDHYFPHSKGGATSMRNAVAACPKCNITKSAHLPSALGRALLQARRRSYFPAGIERTAGEWYRGGAR